MFKTVKFLYKHIFDKKSLIKFSYKDKDKKLTERSNFLRHFATLETQWNVRAMMLAYWELREKYPNYRPLFIFEDPAQCEYTNMHAMEDFYFDEDEYLKNNSEEDLPYAEFNFTLNELKKVEEQVDIKDVKSKINLDTNALEVKAFKKALGLPKIYEEIEVYLCPTQDSTDCFARMINGYFVDDLQPRENYALICHLAKKYNYEFVGLGATLLLFSRKTKLTNEEKEGLTEDLAYLYNLSYEKMKEILLYMHDFDLAIPYGESLLNLYDEEDL